MSADVETVHLPLPRKLLEFIEEKMAEESRRNPQLHPLRETYIAGILANWWLNMKAQIAMAQYQKQTVADLTREAEGMVDVTSNALQKPVTAK